MSRVYEAKPNQDGILEIPLYRTKFSIEYKDKWTGQPTHVPITVSPYHQVFYALFPVDQVDFQLTVNNLDSKHLDISYDLQLHGKTCELVQAKNSMDKLTSVETFGPKFHFIRQDGREGRALVSAAATRHGLFYEEASVMVSRFNFRKIQFGTISSPARAALKRGKDSRKIQIFVKTIRGNTLRLEVATEDKVETLKKILEDREGIPSTDQRLMYTKYSLHDGHALGCYGIVEGATVIMYGGSIKGGQSSRSSSVSTEVIDPLTDVEEFVELEGADAADLGSYWNDMNTEGRGVICSGGRSSQEFDLCHFASDASVYVKPFVIEMRMASTFNLF